ncbi:MAG: pseudouridine synthase [Thermomicrobiales bacterium]
MATDKPTKSPKGGATVGKETGLERLQKVLAARGVASRRAAEELIVEGRVRVDGQVARELGTKVDPQRAEIRVDGKILQRPRPRYFVLNKPRGYLTTASDPEGRRTVYDLLSANDQRDRVFPIGRLDMDSEGLLLLTNDGEFANRIAHPRYRIDKEYHALVTGTPSPGALDQIRGGGFMLDGGRTSPAQVEVLEQSGQTTLLRVIIHEGRRRQVRRIMEEIGHPVQRLRRVRLGPLTLAGLPAAAYRPLTAGELQRLRLLVRLETGTPVQPGSGEESPAFRRINEPRALSGRKPLPKGPSGAKGRESAAGERSPGYKSRDEHGPRPKQEGQGGAGGRKRDDQGRNRGGRPDQGGPRPAPGGSRRPRRPGAPPHDRH